MSMPDTMPCKRCAGAGDVDDVLNAGKKRKCYCCDGQGHFAKPDAAALVKSILSTKSKTGLVSKRPDDDRAYYLWRWVRFHKGDDVTLPVTAMSAIAGDPYEEAIDEVARYVAHRLSGHSSVGVARWGRLLTNAPEPADLHMMPGSAHSCGPVADADKPASEQLELF